MESISTLLDCCLQLRNSQEEREQHLKSRKIDEELKREKQSRRQVNLLLLGAGESGKSTFLKQMKIIHGIQFDPGTLSEFQCIIYDNIIRGMKVLIDAREKLGIEWENVKNSDMTHVVLRTDNAKHLLHFQHYDLNSYNEFVYSVQELWRDRGIKLTYDRRREFQLCDSVKYFFDDLERVLSKDYLPSNQDILHARKATKGVTEFVLSINSIPFRFVDVGGQRSQRQKWLQCFGSVTAIIFLVSSSEYDQVLLEDRRTRRLEESRNIFETVVNFRYLHSVAFILFLNKTDLLQTKLESRLSIISDYFPDFQGNPFNLREVQSFILNMFITVRQDTRRVLYHHFTTAIDTENMKVVFGAVKDFILQKHLETLMLQ